MPYGLNGILNVNTVFSNVSNTSFTLLLNGIYKNMKFTQLGSNNIEPITKVRFVRKGGDGFIDLYYATNTENAVYVNIFGFSKNALFYPTGQTQKVEESDYDFIHGAITL